MLFDLVKSLSGSEKGYYKKWITNGLNESSSKNYLKVLSALDNMEEENDALLSQKTELAKGKLSLTKNYLFGSLLNALSEFHSENLPALSFLKTIENFYVLAARGLSDDAHRQLNKALNFAKEHELFHYQLELIHQKRRLWLQINTEDRSLEDIQSLNLDYQNCLSAWENYRVYEELLFTQSELMVPSYTIVKKELKERHIQLMNHPAIVGEIVPISVRAQHYLVCIKLNFYALAGKRQEALEEAAKQLDLCKSHAYFQEVDNLPILNAFNQCLTATYYSGDLVALGNYLEELSALTFKNQMANLYRFLYHSLFSLVYYDGIKDKEAVMELSKRAEAEMLNYLRYIRSDLFLALVTAFSSAMLEYGNYSLAIRWIEVYRQNLKLKKLFDTQTTLQVFQMIAHFKKGNLDLVENILVSFERFLKKNGEDAFDKAIVRTFHTLLKGDYQNTIPKLLQELKAGFELNPAGKNLNIAPILKVFLVEIQLQ